MKPNEMYSDDKETHLKVWTDEQVVEMWPQARGELLGFSRALDRNAGITASQLRMAIWLADRGLKNQGLIGEVP